MTPGEPSLLPSGPLAGRARFPRVVWHTLGLVAAALVAYVVWRGYQSPDFVIDLAAMRFC